MFACSPSKTFQRKFYSSLSYHLWLSPWANVFCIPFVRSSLLSWQRTLAASEITRASTTVKSKTFSFSDCARLVEFLIFCLKIIFANRLRRLNFDSHFYCTIIYSLRLINEEEKSHFEIRSSSTDPKAGRSHSSFTIVDEFSSKNSKNWRDSKFFLTNNFIKDEMVFRAFRFPAPQITAPQVRIIWSWPPLPFFRSKEPRAINRKKEKLKNFLSFHAIHFKLEHYKECIFLWW